MTYLEALYGSQFYEISQRGGDGKKGRTNGNMFLAVFIILVVVDILMLGILSDAVFKNEFTAVIHRWFGEMTGKSIGKLLGLVLFGIIYFIIIKTIGTEKNYNRIIDNFMQYPDEIKKKANKKILIPFFILLVILLIGAFS